MSRTDGRARTRPLQLFAVAVLAPLLALGGAGAAGAAEVGGATAGTVEATATDGTVASGEFAWGVRSSIRNYLENFGHTEGWVAAYAPATYVRGSAAATFPGGRGTVDPAAGTASLAFDGQLEMFGFGEAWLYFENPRLEVADGTAEVVVDLIETYNVKSRVDDFVIATYAVDAEALQPDDDGTVSFTTGEGTFSADMGTVHLPAFGGPTYGPPNDWTDPISVRLSLQGEGGDPDDEEPGVEEPGVDEPGQDEGPYGTSTGAALSGTDAHIRVTPGFSVLADAPTTLTIEGFGFDPGPAVEPGTGSGGIYVVFGQAAEPGTENWRRSQGGLTGPGQDLNYGSPRFVGNQGSSDADVADGVMDASGHWSIEVSVPGSVVPSFFGGAPLDCVAGQCGVFSFGAHGAIKAANEAYTPVYFEGQDESTWPDRDDDDPTVVPPVVPEKPASPPSALPVEGDLVESARGGVQVLAVNEDKIATVSVGTAHADTYVGVSVHPDPQFLDWFLVPATGRIAVPLPAALEGDHKLSVIGTDESLVGWAPFAIEADDDTDPPGGDIPTKGDPYGESTGVNETTGATLTVTPAWSLGDSDQRVDLRGTGFATSNNGSSFGGAYVLFGWVDTSLGDDWGPGGGGQSGRTFAYAADGASAGTYQSMINYPGNATGEGFPTIGADGSWELEGFPIQSSRFVSAQGTTIDCYVQQCGILTIGAHGSANAGVEVFTPVYFTDERPPGTTPPPADNGGVVANPNVVGQNSGLTARTGLAALAEPTTGRTLFIGGVLLLSMGLFAGAVLRLRGRVPTTA